jgi:5,10-methylene-tetrahydrofolate dehydrogenase/methenyl tetrahydrofolate cyclohydrolase
MTADIIDGKAFAADVRERVAAHVARLTGDRGLTPGLAVVIVGSDPASEIYVRNKQRQTVEAGMQSFEHRLPEATAEVALLALIARLNADPAVHGILCQLPLPGISTPMRSSTRSIPPRMSTAFTSPMWVCWRPGRRRWCPARRWAV